MCYHTFRILKTKKEEIGEGGGQERAPWCHGLDKITTLQDAANYFCGFCVCKVTIR